MAEVPETLFQRELLFAWRDAETRLTASGPETRLTASGPEKLREFVEAVRGHLHWVLDLKGSPLAGNAGLLRAEAIAAALRGSRVIVLRLPCTGLSNAAVRLLAPALKDSRVRILELDSNHIGLEGAQALASGLPASSVRSLGLYNNWLWDGGVLALAAALKDTSIAFLELGANRIRAEGVRALAAHLTTSSVTTLGLSMNKLGDEGAKAIAAVLQESSIQKLDLDRNLFGEEGTAALLEVLPDSPVTELGLRDCGLADESLRQIEAVLEANKARSFVLQMEVQQRKDSLVLKFRTLGGTEAAVLSGSLDGPVQALPEIVLMSMRRAGFQLPFKGLSAANLKIVPAGGNGALLDVGPTAAPLAQQLGIPTEPPEVSADSGLKRDRECETEADPPSKRSRGI